MWSWQRAALVTLLDQVPYVLSLYTKEEWSADKKAYATMLETNISLVIAYVEVGEPYKAAKLVRKVIRGCMKYSAPEYKGNSERNFKRFSKHCLDEARGLKQIIEDEYAKNPN